MEEMAFSVLALSHTHMPGDGLRGRHVCVCVDEKRWSLHLLHLLHLLQTHSLTE